MAGHVMHEPESRASHALWGMLACNTSFHKQSAVHRSAQARMFTPVPHANHLAP